VKKCGASSARLNQGRQSEYLHYLWIIILTFHAQAMFEKTFICSTVQVINDHICSVELIATRKMRFACYQTLSASHFLSCSSDEQPQVNHWNNVLDVWEVNNENNLHHDIPVLYHSEGANVNYKRK
jgi:hypothetical protein